MRSSILLILSAAALAPVGASAADEPGMDKLTPRAAQAVELARSYQATESETAAGARKGTDPGPKQDVKPGELAARYAAPRKTEIFVQPDGSVIATLGDEHLEDLVAVRKPDGSVSMECAKDLDPRGLEARATTEEE